MPEQCVFESKWGNKVRVIDATYRQAGRCSWPVRVYMPEKPGMFPALLDVHGGAWSSGSCSDNESIDISLAASGIVVFAIECRKAPDYTYPAQVADINYAARWIKTHGKDYNAEPQFLGGLGTSSGGHGLFLCAMRPDDERYNEFKLKAKERAIANFSYLIAAWPVLDPLGRYLFAQENNRDFLVRATNSYFLHHNAMIEGNPLLALEREEQLVLPPALIIQGTADGNLPLDSLNRFATAYHAAGGDIEVEWFDDMPHGFACKPGTESDRAVEIMTSYAIRQITKYQ